MDRLLDRLGRSKHATEFYLKGGLLVANLVDAPHRFTRDIDVLRRYGRPSPDDLRELFREIIAVPADDGIVFRPDGVTAVEADHDEDGYDGVKVYVRATVERREVAVRIDVGFGDAVVPSATKRTLAPFLYDDEPARVMAYEAAPVIAEKVETLIAKFPVVLHRLKDVLDVVTLSDTQGFDGPTVLAALRASFERRRTPPDVRVLDDMQGKIGQRDWERTWATMLKEKAVVTRSSFERPSADSTASSALFSSPSLVTARHLLGGSREARGSDHLGHRVARRAHRRSSRRERRRTALCLPWEHFGNGIDPICASVGITGPHDATGQ